MLVDIIEDYNISKPDIDFRFNCNSEVSVYGNYDKLSILFYNIYKNAVEAISDNGVIETLCYESDNNVVIKIRDNGVGIEDIESVGTPYYTTKPNGTGLGIIICKNIVSEHNGIINFENTAVGSQVTIKLPLKI